jgi:hypothetical protein
MSLVEDYITELRDIRASGAGVKETSYYPALSNLFNGIGRSLSPQVRCIMTLRNLGAGMPDGGLFTPDQFPKASDTPMEPQNPARGVVEVKGTKDDAWVITEGEQVSRYWGKYRQVLVTNLRDFVLIGQDDDGRPSKVEMYRLASSEQAFWKAAGDPRAFAIKQGDLFTDFLKRVLLQSAPLTTPQDVAWLLASYARDARVRVEKGKLVTLKDLRAALEQALGLTFEGGKGDHFFRSTLVQTLFYGIFSAWVLWCQEHPNVTTAARFDWRTAAWSLRVPMIRVLFEQLALPTKLEPLGLVEVLDRAAGVLNRVDRTLFFARFEETHAVQYFYEPFLEAFDPVLRKEMGVWYTPPEVARYMVERVDTVLREDLGRPDGLADPQVYILDPATGTATYPVEIVKRIARTIRERGEDALAANDIKEAALTRIFGFEILPAPFVVAHLQMGLVLHSLGAPLLDAHEERASIYLTNALTGWDLLTEPKQRFLFPELESEREAAERIKQETPILVILGNPPYNGFAGTKIGEERVLTDAYKKSVATRQPQGQGLNDLYVRFYRMAERRIVEKTGAGVVCFISNSSWLDGLSFPAMRERYLETFDHIWIDNLNGDKYKTGKLTPEGTPDPSIFSTEWNREGIQVGTAIALLVRKEEHTPATSMRYRDFWGKNKRAELLASLTPNGNALYETIVPANDLGLPFTTIRSDIDYARWPSLPDIFATSFPGVKTSRDDVVLDVDRDRLIERMRKYFDPAVSDDEMQRIAPGAMQSTARFKAQDTRRVLQQRGFLPENIVRYCYRPFDVRWLYWEPKTKLLDEKREDYVPHVFAGNLWIEARQKQPMQRFDRGYVVDVLADNFGNGLSNYFPLYLRPTKKTLDLFSAAEPRPVDAREINLHDHAKTYLRDLFDAGDSFVALQQPAETLFFHTVAMLHAPAYRVENAGALRLDWPRIPLPCRKDVLLASADLGRTVAALMDVDKPLTEVTAGTMIRPELRAIGLLTTTSGAAEDMDTMLSVMAHWGYVGAAGATMPAQGKLVERAYMPEEVAAIEEGALALGLTLEQALAQLGQNTVDVYLNDGTFWRNVPTKVWEYTACGYQVIKKWLSYRERPILQRPLTSNEARLVMQMARRIAAILLLGLFLDANYESARQAIPAAIEDTIIVG